MELKITRSVIVTPAESTWNGSLTLSELDQIGTTTNTAIIFFYSGPILTPFDAIADTLIESLSQVLVHFYPLAGRLRPVPHGGGRFELLCNGQGAAFFAAVLDADLSDFGDFTPSPDFDKFLFPEIDAEDHVGTPLLLAQVTKFRCGGVSLGVMMSHVVSDGCSGANFLSEWARLARGQPLLNAACMDKTALRAGERRFDHSEDLYCLPYLRNQPDVEEIESRKLVTFTQRLSPGQMEKLIKAANKNCTVIQTGTRPFSRYETLAAHLWRCSSKAREHPGEQLTGCVVTVDARRRVAPPIPPEYLGNAVVDLAATCLAGDLRSKSLAYVAGMIRAVIGRVTDEYVGSLIDFLQAERDVTRFQQPYTSSRSGGGKFMGNPNIGVVSWLNLPFEGTDFGWGLATHFGPGNEEIDGEACVIGTRDGSVIVVMCLLEDHVESFKKHFYEDIYEYEHLNAYD